MQNIVSIRCPICNNSHLIYRYGKDTDFPKISMPYMQSSIFNALSATSLQRLSQIAILIITNVWIIIT